MSDRKVFKARRCRACGEDHYQDAAGIKQQERICRLAAKLNLVVPGQISLTDKDQK